MTVIVEKTGFEAFEGADVRGQSAIGAFVRSEGGNGGEARWIAYQRVLRQRKNVIGYKVAS